MRVDTNLPVELKSSFLSCPKDIEALLKLLFDSNNEYSETLRRLLVVNTPDCINPDSENNDLYAEEVSKWTLGKLREEGYVRLNPKIARSEHEEIKTYMLVSFDNFFPSVSSDFKTCTLNFDIICNNDAWELDNYVVRPLAICGYIDSVLRIQNDNTANKHSAIKVALSGMGNYNFLGCSRVLLNEDFSMYSLSYEATHFTEDLGDVTDPFE